MSAQATGSRPGHEDSDASPGVVGLIACSIAALVAAGLLMGWGFVAAGRGAASRPRVSSPFQDGPQARTGVAQAWADCERDTRLHLAGYGWIDRSAGVVRIPIDRAIDLICAEAPKSAAPGEGRPSP
jgi:hypothetical protein